MREEIRKKLTKMLDKHVQRLNKKMTEHEDLGFILEVLDSLLGKISGDELESLLAIEETDLRDLESLFNDEREKALIHKVSGIRYLVAGIRDRHVKIDITKEQKQIIAKFLKLVSEKKNMILPILERDRNILENDNSRQLLDKLEDLNNHTYLSEVNDIKNLFVEFEIEPEEQYQILYSILEHNQSVYTSLKNVIE
ncbi:MAG: hypothetical protein HFH31_03270 [Bacilli bacterium]|nr:hypothetical protein [Bacilli bacterium]